MKKSGANCIDCLVCKYMYTETRGVWKLWEEDGVKMGGLRTQRALFVLPLLYAIGDTRVTNPLQINFTIVELLFFSSNKEILSLPLNTNRFNKMAPPSLYSHKKICSFILNANNTKKQVLIIRYCFDYYFPITIVI